MGINNCGNVFPSSITWWTNLDPLIPSCAYDVRVAVVSLLQNCSAINGIFTFDKECQDINPLNWILKDW